MSEKVANNLELLEKLRSKLLDISGDEEGDHSEELEYLNEVLNDMCSFLGIL